MYIRTHDDLGEAPTLCLSRSYIGEIRQSPTSVSQPISLTMGTLAFMVLDRFQFGKHSLSKGNQDKVKLLARHVDASWRTFQPIRTIRLVGHTDPTGDKDYNLRLGLRRAVEVQGSLISAIESLKPGLMKQIDIMVDSQGETVPVASNRTRGGRARNRRVEVFISTAATAAPGPIPTTPSPPQIPSPTAVPIPPETNEERLRRILTTPVPPLPPGKSPGERLEEALKGWPPWLRRAIVDLVERGLCESAEALAAQAGLGAEGREAIRAACRASFRTRIP